MKISLTFPKSSGKSTTTSTSDASASSSNLPSDITFRTESKSDNAVLGNIKTLIEAFGKKAENTEKAHRKKLARANLLSPSVSHFASLSSIEDLEAGAELKSKISSKLPSSFFGSEDLPLEVGISASSETFVSDLSGDDFSTLDEPVGADFFIKQTYEITDQSIIALLKKNKSLQEKIYACFSSDENYKQLGTHGSDHASQVFSQLFVGRRDVVIRSDDMRVAVTPPPRVPSRSDAGTPAGAEAEVGYTVDGDKTFTLTFSFLPTATSKNSLVKCLHDRLKLSDQSNTGVSYDKVQSSGMDTTIRVEVKAQQTNAAFKEKVFEVFKNYLNLGPQAKEVDTAEKLFAYMGQRVVSGFSASFTICLATPARSSTPGMMSALKSRFSGGRVLSKEAPPAPRSRARVKLKPGAKSSPSKSSSSKKRTGSKVRGWFGRRHTPSNEAGGKQTKGDDSTNTKGSKLSK